MKVYIGYEDREWDGYSPPLTIYTKEADIWEWLHGLGRWRRDYVELEMSEVNTLKDKKK